MTDPYIEKTTHWIQKVVIGCNFCPFAAKPFNQNQIRFSVLSGKDTEAFLTSLVEEFALLDRDAEIETTLILFPESLGQFETYLDFLELAQSLLENLGYDGKYQLASFHPDYLFDGLSEDDPANFTNRSPYPIVHILREESLENAINSYPDVELIPERNIRFARSKGLLFMQQLLA